jgi:hypothetical protein
MASIAALPQRFSTAVRCDDFVRRPVAGVGAGRSCVRLATPELNGQLTRFRQRNDLLHVEQEPVTDLVRRESHAAQIKAIDIVEPQHRGGDLPIEAAGDQDDPDLAAEYRFLAAGVLEEIGKPRPGFLDCVRLHLRQVQLK